MSGSSGCCPEPAAAAETNKQQRITCCISYECGSLEKLKTGSELLDTGFRCKSKQKNSLTEIVNKGLQFLSDQFWYLDCSHGPRKVMQKVSEGVTAFYC